MALEQREGNGIPLGNATRIIGMQVVSAVVFRKQLRGMAWVTQDHIEIDHTIEFTTAANPVVNLLTHGFPLGKDLKWRQIGALNDGFRMEEKRQQAAALHGKQVAEWRV